MLKVSWPQIVTHVFGIALAYISMTTLIAIILVSIGWFDGGNVTGKEELASVIFAYLLFTVCFYISARRAKNNAFIHVLFVSTATFIGFMAPGMWYHDGNFENYLETFIFIYSTMLAGYALWYWKSHKTLRGILSR